MSLFQQKYPNSIRTVAGLINVPFQDDVVLECDTTLSPVGIQLQTIPANYWSTQYKLYIVDKSNNASVNNIVITAPLGYKINGLASITINVNGGSCLIRVIGNTNYVSQYSSATSGGYSTIQDEGIALPSRPIINFVGGDIVATDDAINNRTNVTYVTPTPPATVWNDVLNLKNMVSNPVTDLFKPQYTITGNKIDLRGLLYIPLENGGFPINVTIGNSYLYEASAITDNSRMSIISNANNNNGTPQGRFCTPDVVLERNFPPSATPLQGDIRFDDVPAYRRYSTGLGGILTIHRTFLDIRICGVNTVLNNSGNLGVGCIAILSPFSYEYDGSGSVPSGNDPQGLVISRAVAGQPVNDYIGATDNSPFAVGVGLLNSPFNVNAHNITSLGGFIINLNGLSGYLN
jgi:hypothetical protein